MASDKEKDSDPVPDSQGPDGYQSTYLDPKRNVSDTEHWFIQRLTLTVAGFLAYIMTSNCDNALVHSCASNGQQVLQAASSYQLPSGFTVENKLPV